MNHKTPAVAFEIAFTTQHKIMLEINGIYASCLYCVEYAYTHNYCVLIQS